MGAIWALLPVKAPGQAKSRLAAALDEDERASLARHLTRGVITALQGVHGITGVALLGSDPQARDLAREAGCRWLADDPALGLSGNADAALVTLAAAGAGTVIIVPADLPLLGAADVEALLAAHAGGVTVVPAASDGGTNALAMTPPGAIPCRYGPDSARLHLEAARQRGIPARYLATAEHPGLPGVWCQAPAPGPPAGFARDLDTVDDVRWLCAQPGGGAARQYLEDSGICARLRARD